MTTDSSAPIVVIPALEPPDGQPSARILAKGLAASLARSLFCGEIVIFRNRETSVFRLERKGIKEKTVKPSIPRSLEDVTGVGNDYPLFGLVEFLQPHPRQRVIIAGSTCVVLRNIGHLIPADGKGILTKLTFQKILFAVSLLPLNLRFKSVSNRKRWIVPSKSSLTRPAIYHVLRRVVDRRFVFYVD